MRDEAGPKSEGREMKAEARTHFTFYVSRFTTINRRPSAAEPKVRSQKSESRMFLVYMDLCLSAFICGENYGDQ
jgi:hypothetical protein